MGPSIYLSIAPPSSNDWLTDMDTDDDDYCLQFTNYNLKQAARYVGDEPSTTRGFDLDLMIPATRAFLHSERTASPPLD